MSTGLAIFLSSLIFALFALILFYGITRWWDWRRIVRSAFGYFLNVPSSFGTTVTLEGDQESVYRRVQETLHHLVEKCSWKMDSIHGEQVVLSTPCSFTTGFGEIVTIQIEGNSIGINSRCNYIWQLFDWGKNRANVNLVERELKFGETTLLKDTSSKNGTPA